MARVKKSQNFKGKKSRSQAIADPNYKRKRKTLGKNKFWQYFLFSLLGLVVLALILTLVLRSAFSSKFYPKTTVAGVTVNSMSQAEALAVLNQKIVAYQKQNLTITVGKNQKTITVSDLTPNYDPQTTLQNLFQLDHPNTFWQTFAQMPQIIKLLFTKQNMPLAVSIKKIDQLQAAQKTLSSSAVSASFYLDNNGQLAIKDEQNGFGVSEADLENQTTKALSFLNQNVNPNSQVLKPAVTKDNLVSIESQVQKIISLAPIKLMADKKAAYSLSQTDLLSLMDFSVSAFGTTSLKLNSQNQATIFAKIKAVVDQPSQPLKLTHNDNGTTSILQKDQQGQTLNENDLALQLTNFFADPQSDSLTLSLSQSLATINSNNYAKLDFKDLLGSATTTFYGSDSDRLTDIQLGSAAINGQIVASGDTFSLGAGLGEVSAATGYKMGWVISGNTIDTGIGGGLCQVATTLFHTALNSGLPIVARVNHTFLVGFYQPVGMDATISYPPTDFEFKNDTGSPLLIQTAVDGYSATFSFYGKSDGRKVSIGNMSIYNVVAAPTNIQYVNDPNLAKGTSAVLEDAVVGEDTSFDYTVTRAVKVINQQTFTSHYQPWPEVVIRN
jgi:vancomycin resistance protein YoaR